MSLHNNCLVVIPTYNEIENVTDIINAVINLSDRFQVLIVDDNSPDRTAEAVKSHKLFDKRLHLIQRPGKLGLGTAYIEGFKFGLENKYQYIFEMDADFSHNPSDLLRLLNACENEHYDIAIGSRYVKNGGISNWNKYRLFLSFSASLYVRMVTWMNVKDPTAGFICYKSAVLNSMDLNKINFTGYAFQIQMKYYAHKLGFKWKEVPIVFSDRIKGQSKMSANIVKEAIRGVLALRIKSLQGFYTKKKL